MADNNSSTGGINVNALLSRIDPAQFQKTVQDAQNSGKPIFTLNDLRTTSRPLAQLIRLLLIKEGITQEKFKQLHRDMAMQTYMATNGINYDRNNMCRAMTQADVTWCFLEKMLVVCGYDLADISLTLTNRKTGEVSTISRSDVQELIKDNPYHPAIVIDRVDGVTE